MDDIRFMKLALKEAHKAYKKREVPVGAVLVDFKGNIISRAYNGIEELQDPTAHAEILAIRRAAKKINNWRLENTTLYSTLEPCTMCAGSALQARIKRIVYSALRASGFGLVDLGRVEVDDVVHQVRDKDVKIILLSTLMLPSALKVREIRDKLNQTNGEIKIVVGGAPFRFDDQLWQEVGADAMGRNASDAVEIITKITGDIT